MKIDFTMLTELYFFPFLKPSIWIFNIGTDFLLVDFFDFEGDFLESITIQKHTNIISKEIYEIIGSVSIDFKNLLSL